MERGCMRECGADIYLLDKRKDQDGGCNIFLYIFVSDSDYL